MSNTAERADQVIAALHAGHDHLASVVRGLDAADLTRKSGAVEWDVSQVLSHLGSGAVTGRAVLDGALDGTGPKGAEFNKSAWARWDAMSPGERAERFVSADEELVARYESLDARTREALRITLGFLHVPVDVATLAGLRLGEVTFHTWDVEVTFDPAAVPGARREGTLLGQTGLLIGRLGQADAVDGRPVRLAIRTTSPDRSFRVDLGETVALGDPSAVPDVALSAPAEWWLRLMTGRHAPAYTPASVTLTGEALTLDDLRRVFPGF